MGLNKKFWKPGVSSVSHYLGLDGNPNTFGLPLESRLLFRSALAGVYRTVKPPRSLSQGRFPSAVYLQTLERANDFFWRSLFFLVIAFYGLESETPRVPPMERKQRNEAHGHRPLEGP